MRVLLVYPEFPDTYWSFRQTLAFYGKKSIFPPLGLLTVAGMLPDSWERRLIDLNVQSLRDDDVKWADVVFVSAMLIQNESLQKVIEHCKQHGKRVAVGGPCVNANNNHITSADHLFTGEAETTLPLFIEDLERGEAKRFYQAAERPSLELAPLPDFQLVDFRHYFAMPVQFSRGCPFQCEFCDIIEIYGRHPRTKSNEQVLGELDQLNRLGWRGMVFLVDDNFIGNKPNVKRMLPALAEWNKRHNHPYYFLTEASVNLADDDELLAMMRDAGFRSLFLGIETPIEESLKEAQKLQNTRNDLLNSISRIQSYGMEVMAGFIVGFDNDPDDIFQRQINFIRERAIPIAMVGLLQALPGTQLSRRLEREGRLLADSNGNFIDGSLTYIPRMKPARLVEGYNLILQNIYDTDHYYRRVLNCLDRVARDEPEPRSSSFFYDLIALLRVVLRLGIRDPHRMAFWKFLQLALTSHRDKFVTALRLAAMGYDLRRLAELNILDSAGKNTM